MEYYFKTDFSIVETFTDAEGNPINLNDFDFELIYKTTGVNNYRVSKKGTTFIHCSIDEADTSKLNVIFKDHRLGCGQLHREISIKVGNPLFEDYQLIVTHPFTEITLVQNGGDQTTGYASAGIPVVISSPPSVITDIADADSFLGISELGIFFKTTWLSIKAKLKAYFDTIYASITHNHNLNYLAEKSYNSLDDLPSLDFEPANENIQSHIGDGDIHVTSLQKEDFHAHTNKTALDAVKGVNTGDQSSSDFDIKDLADTTNLRSIWSGKQDALTFSTNIETDKSSTTKISAIKTMYDWAVGKFYDKSAADLLLVAKEDITNKSSNVDTDKTSTTKYANVKAIYDWAVGKFIDLTKLVTSWSATPTHDNIPSEKLVKDSLNLKADIAPANGSTSALRALFTSVPQANCVYNTNTGYYEMNGITNLTEQDVMRSYHALSAYRMSSGTAYQGSNIRTNFYLGLRVNADIAGLSWCQGLITLEVFKVHEGNIFSTVKLFFYGCSNLVKAETFRIIGVTSTANTGNMFFGCVKLETAYIRQLRVSFSFSDCPLLSLESLQYLVTNRYNETTRITITVHQTVWAKLNDAVNYPEWNALLVDAVNNQYIDFASA